MDSRFSADGNELLTIKGHFAQTSTPFTSWEN